MLERVLGRTSLSLLALLLSGQAAAIGLGELRNQPVLGEAIRLEVGLLGVDKQRIDASCFRLVQHSADDLPSLRRASFGIRHGADPVLEIRSEVPLREPVVQMTVQVGCGHEISRSYILMASPVREIAPPAVSVHREQMGDESPARPVERRPLRERAPQAVADEAPVRLRPGKPARSAKAPLMPDRLVLSGSDGAIGEPSLRLATELLSAAVAKEAQRDILRLEYRMLMALHEQASSQMAAAEKLRNMEGALAELQARAGEFAQRVEKGVASPVTTVQVQVAEKAPVAQAPVVTPPPIQPKTAASSVEAETPWSLYGLLLGALLGVGGWLGWRRYREGQETAAAYEPLIVVPEVRVDPQREEEHEELGGIDLPVEPAAMGMPMQVDFELENNAAAEMQPEPVLATPHPAGAPDSVLSINATTLDEHFEANPVMELADIMLSFGRVKGAAQALQEFIDHNPEEALQPWIRLMDVYRMAGMRSEFESVARNLNQHFNVEVQSWDGGAAETGRSEGDPVGPRPQSLEDMPRLMNTVVEQWDSGDVVGYLYQLLRDNRGGQRQGFALPVVDDILFLIELKETANRME